MPLILGSTDVFNTAAFGSIELEARGLNLKLAAIALRAKGGSLVDPAGSALWVLVKEIEIGGTGPRTVVVQTTDSTPTDATEYYAAQTAAKFSHPKLLPIDAGEATEIEALQLARRTLRNQIELQAEVTVRISGDLPFGPLPKRGDTVRVMALPRNGITEVFTGVVREKTYSVNNSIEELELRLVDYSSEDLR